MKKGEEKTLNKYEAMFIFPESVKDSELEEVLTGARDEIKKAGGEIDSTTRLGKRAFARKMNKQDAGHYAIVSFQMAKPDGLPALLARYKLDEQVFRVQIVRASEKPAAVAGEKGKKDGNA